MELVSSLIDKGFVSKNIFCTNNHSDSAEKIQSVITYHWINCSDCMRNALPARISQSLFKGQPLVIVALSQLFCMVSVGCCCHPRNYV